MVFGSDDEAAAAAAGGGAVGGVGQVTNYYLFIKRIIRGCVNIWETMYLEEGHHVM